MYLVKICRQLWDFDYRAQFEQQDLLKHATACVCVNLLLCSTKPEKIRIQDGFDVLLRSATQNQFVVLYF